MPLSDLAALVQDMTSVDEVPRVLAKPTHPFLLQHHPNAWEVADVDGQPTWVPILSPRILRAGANGVRTLRANEPADAMYSSAIEKDKRQGITTLPLTLQVAAEHLPEGMPAGRYIRAVDVTDPVTKTDGKRHIEAWQYPVPTPPGQLQEFEFDRASYDKWRAHLVVSGVVGKPPRSVVTKYKRRHGNRVAQAEVANLPDEVRQRRVKEQQADLDRVTAAKTPEAPKPRKVK